MNKNNIFYRDALSMLTPFRFDIAAKHYYAKYKDVKSNFPLDLYLSHLQVWNNFSEFNNNNKQNKESFVSEFNNIIDSIEKDGFDESKSVVPIDKSTNSPLNGAHRIATCILKEKMVACCEAPSESGQLDCSYYFFKNRSVFVEGGLNQTYLDAMALNYAKLKNNTFMITLFPTALCKFEKAREIIVNSTDVVCEKAVPLGKYGPFNFIRTLYDGEPWAGNWQVGFQGVNSKAEQCYNAQGPTYVFLVQTDDPDTLRTLKQNVRDLYNVGNHSIHINDYHYETIRIASAVFNQNSINFLNELKPTYLKNFELYFQKYKNWHAIGNHDQDDFCVDASAVLSAYGLRDCRDLDFLYAGEDINTGLTEINCHNEELKYYRHHKDDIIFNPNNHFYYNGFKFASPEVIRQMKKNRSEPKDLVDVQLLSGVMQ